MGVNRGDQRLERRGKRHHNIGLGGDVKYSIRKSQ